MKLNGRVVYFSNLQWLLLSLVIVVLDISTKSWVMSNCVLGRSMFLLPFVNCYYIYNFGVAFSLFSDLGIIQHGMLLFVIIFVILILCVMLCCMNSSYTYFLKVAYAMVIGGALGNMIDRIRYGVVIDFIDFHILAWHFPTFNIADLSIFIGVIMILLYGYK